MTTIEARPELLTEEMLHRFDERAPQYDRENRFFDEDFAELVDAGYLKAPLPTEYGGSGLSLLEVNRLQRQLAYYAAPTALAVNMHLYFVGMAADMQKMGDPSGSWVLDRAAEGAVFAAGHGEVGNDLPLLLATSRADRVDGGWEITGHKIFGSLSPVWSYLGFHAMDSSDPAAPTIVHGFLDRNATHYRIEETWDVLGMRATASHDTIMDRTFVPDSNVMLVCPAGMAGAGLFHVALFAWGLLGFGAVYYGLARRAYDEVVKGATTKSSMALQSGTMAHHPEVQHMVADMRIALETSEAMLEHTSADWSNGVDHGGDWPIKIVATKYSVVNQCWSVVDTALDVSGGGGIFKRTRLEQIVRDARLGRIHPANTMLTHELVGKLSLGIDPDFQPRWG